LGEINFGLLWFYLILILIVAILCFFITIFLGKLILKGISRINLRYVNILILGSLFLIVFVLTNFYGVLILVLSSSLGLLALGLGVKRIHLMSVLLVPVIFNLL